MKKLIIVLLIIALGIFGAIIAVRMKNVDKKSVSYNGWLSVDGANIINAHKENIQLVGISSSGIQWFGDLYSKEGIAKLKEEFGINVFRIAMYTDPKSDGYIKNNALREKAYELIDVCIELDIYVIMDWHILNDNNPQTYKDEAVAFFGEVSEKYADEPNVIYEICNEPNGEVSWSEDIKPYAEEVIAKIREHSPKSLVIVGTGRWSTELTDASHDALSDENVAYALHFYAGSHNKTLRDKIDNFREKGLAVFVSECGATDATGDGDLYEDAFLRWTDYMNEKQISWVYWSYSNKGEGTAMLKKGESPNYSEENFNFDDYLSPSGLLFKRVTVVE